MFCCFVNEKKKSEEYYKGEAKNYLEQIIKLEREIKDISLTLVREHIYESRMIIADKIIKLRDLKERNENQIQNLQKLSGNSNLYMEVIYELADKAGVSVKKVPQG